MDTSYEILTTYGIMGLEPYYLRLLADLPQAEYDHLIRMLLEKNLDTALINGCVLFTLRPNPEMYQDILSGSLRITDPSFNVEAAIALIQIKPPHQIALELIDLLEHLDHSDTIKLNISSLLYWIGISPQRLNSWSYYYYILGYISWAFQVVYTANEGHTKPQYFTDLVLRTSLSAKNISAEGYPIVSVNRTFPNIDQDVAQRAAIEIVNRLLIMFEQKKVGVEAAISLELLARVDIEQYPSREKNQIIKAYSLANKSSDQNIRSLVSGSFHQSLINMLDF